MLQDLIWNAHCSRSMFAIFPFQIWSLTKINLEHSSGLLIVRDHMALEHIVQGSWNIRRGHAPKSQKKLSVRSFLGAKIGHVYFGDCDFWLTGFDFQKKK